jgi:hypothetical protein
MMWWNNWYMFYEHDESWFWRHRQILASFFFCHRYVLYINTNIFLEYLGPDKAVSCATKERQSRKHRERSFPGRLIPIKTSINVLFWAFLAFLRGYFYQTSPNQPKPWLVGADKQPERVLTAFKGHDPHC